MNEGCVSILCHGQGGVKPQANCILHTISFSQGQRRVLTNLRNGRGSKNEVKKKILHVCVISSMSLKYPFPSWISISRLQGNSFIHPSSLRNKLTSTANCKGSIESGPAVSFTQVLSGRSISLGFSFSHICYLFVKQQVSQWWPGERKETCETTPRVRVREVRPDPQTWWGGDNVMF